MGHVNPVCLPRKPDSHRRWETSNSEYGKFYVLSIYNKEIGNSQEVHNDVCSKKCEVLSKELQEAKAQLEKLKISCNRSLGNAVACQTSRDAACQTLPGSPLKLDNCREYVKKPGPPSKNTYVTQPNTGLEIHDPQMLLEHINGGHPQQEKRVKPKLNLRPLSTPRKVGRNYQGEIEDNGGMECCKIPTTQNKLGGGLHCGRSGTDSRSSSRGSGKDRLEDMAGKRKIVQKQGGALKKQKGLMLKTTSDIKHTAASGANLPPSQRYNFYRNFGYAGQGAKTSKGWHPMKTPWMARET